MDGIKTDDFTGQVEPQHLLLAVLVDYVTLETTRTNRCNGLEFVTGTENMLAGLDWPGFVYDIFKLLSITGIQAAR